MKYTEKEVRKVITVKNVNKYFDGFHALKDLSLHVESGSIYGLVGTNGSGKTTIIKHLAGILKQDSGGNPVRRRTRI